MLTRIALAALALAVAAGPAVAANARNPYGNVDRRVDAGNDTGDSQVDRLNRAQLDQNYYNANPPQALGAPAPYGTAPAPYPYGYGR